MNKEETPLDMYPDCDDEVISLLHDLSKGQTEIISTVEESSEIDCDTHKKLKSLQEKILSKVNDISDHHFIIPEHSKDHKKVPAPHLILVLLSTSLVIALAAGIYSLDRLNNLNNEWQMKIEKKIDEISTLNKIIDFSEEK